MNGSSRINLRLLSQAAWFSQTVAWFYRSRRIIATCTVGALVSLLAFRQARPEQLAQLEGSLSLLDRLERQFPRERLAELHAAADHLAGELATAAATAPGPRRRAKRARRRRTDARAM